MQQEHQQTSLAGDLKGFNFADRDNVRAHLDWVRQGYEVVDEMGRKRKIRRPAHLVNRDVVNIVQRHLEARGEFFRAPHPFYFDRADNCLIGLIDGDPKFATLLRGMGFLPKEPHTVMIARLLSDLGNAAPERPVHRLAYFDGSTVYIRQTETSMLKVTVDSITEVPLGTEGVLLIADDLGDLPTLAELMPHVDALRPRLGCACTKIRPDLPLARLTSRWSDDIHFSAEQQWQMAMTRFLFTFCATPYALWPLQIFNGEGNSGKSTWFELQLVLLGGMNDANDGNQGLLDAMPPNQRSLIALLTNASLAYLDNVDEVDTRGELNDTICRVATGAKIGMARLFHNNVLDTYRLRLHVGFTARVNPFDRDDVMRRAINLRMADPVRGTAIDKKTLFKQVIENRSAMLAELLLRVQNIVRAHATADQSFILVTKMPEYEKFTYICAAYEGTLTETQTLWTAYVRRYEQTITDSDALVHAVRLWLGKGRNAGRQVSPTTLFIELQSLCFELQQPFTYKSSASFGKNILRHKTPLSVLGLAEVPTRSNKDYIFKPSPEEIELSKRLYEDVHKAILLRPVPLSGQTRPTPGVSYQPQPRIAEGLDNLDDLDDNMPTPYNRKEHRQ